MSTKRLKGSNKYFMVSLINLLIQNFAVIELTAMSFSLKYLSKELLYFSVEFVTYSVV